MGKGNGLEAQVAKALITNGYTISTAESCTGGLISHRLTNIPGSSKYFERGIIVYSNESKMEMLGVPEEVLMKHGAVSEQAAEAMAGGVRSLAKTDFGLAVTGIAGPTGGTEEKPVGLVYIALASSSRTIVKKYNFTGKRHLVKEKTSDVALELLLNVLDE